MKLVVIALAVLGILVGPADAVLGQEGGTPPVTVIPIPEPAPGAEVPTPPPTVDTPAESGPTAPASPEPTPQTPVDAEASSGTPVELPWLAIGIAALASSALTAAFMSRRRRLDSGSGTIDVGGASPPYELLAFVFEEAKPGDLGLRVLTHGEFQAVDKAIEAAHAQPAVKSLAGNEARVWWVLTEKDTGIAGHVIKPKAAMNGGAGSLTRIERLLSDLYWRLEAEKPSASSGSPRA